MTLAQYNTTATECHMLLAVVQTTIGQKGTFKITAYPLFSQSYRNLLTSV